MRSKILQDILDETPKDVEIFVRLYADITLRINQLLKEKGMSQKEWAESMGKKPSEISKWLKGDHNFTLRSLAKIMAELDEVFLYVPKQHVFQEGRSFGARMIVHRNRKMMSSSQFESFKIKSKKVGHAQAS